MTVEELMKLADAYARAYAYSYERQSPAPNLVHAADKARAALEEAMTLTSQFGGL